MARVVTHTRLPHDRPVKRRTIVVDVAKLAAVA